MKRKEIITCMLVCTLMLIGTACNDNDDNGLVYEEAVLSWADPATDGCGLAFHTGTAIYYPVDLSAIDSQYYQTGLTVEINYTVLPTKHRCAWQETDYNQIELHKIRLKK